MRSNIPSGPSGHPTCLRSVAARLLPASRAGLLAAALLALAAAPGATWAQDQPGRDGNPGAAAPDGRGHGGHDGRGPADVGGPAPGGHAGNGDPQGGPGGPDPLGGTPPGDVSAVGDPGDLPFDETPPGDTPPDDTPGLIEAPEGAALMSGSDVADLSLMDATGDVAVSPQAASDAHTLPPVRRAAPEGWGAAAAMMGTAAAPPSAPAAPMNAGPVVVELFTAQGCSSCPPADRMFTGLTARPDVLPLAWHVDYWDYLGWADQFARPENTARQEGYARAVGEQGVYTPQMIVGGQDTALSVRHADLMAMIEDHRARPAAIMVTASDDGPRHVIQLTPRAAIPGGVRVVLVRYAPLREVTIRAGENRGKTVAYANIVLGTEELATWDAHSPLRLTVSPGGGAKGSFPADTLHAILAQQALPGKGGMPGPILAAVRLD